MGCALQAWGITRYRQNGTESRPVLNDVSFSVAEGESIAIMGPSGSGKSTLLSLIGLLDRPNFGRLEVLSQDVAHLDDDARSALRARQIGFVFQDYHLLARWRVLDNVALPLLYQGLPASEREHKAKKALENVGMSEFEDRYPNQLSGGERQRVAIARALVNDPALVLADEPTGALDQQTSQHILSQLMQVCAKGRTLVLVTHDADVAVRASRCLQLQNGALVHDQARGAGKLERRGSRDMIFVGQQWASG